MQTIKAPIQLRSRSSSRVLAGRRLRAARVMAGNVSLRAVADAAGVDYWHVSRVERGQDPLTATDCDDLAGVLGVPSEWLRDGW